MCEQQCKQQPHARRQPAGRGSTLVNPFHDKRAAEAEPDRMGKHDDAQKQRGNPHFRVPRRVSPAFGRHREHDHENKQDQADIAREQQQAEIKREQEPVTTLVLPDSAPVVQQAQRP